MKNLNTILPFYDAITEQYRYREDADIAPCLTVSSANFIPFMIRRLHSTGTTANVLLEFFDLNGNSLYQVAGNTFGLYISSGTVHDWIYYPDAAVPVALPTGSAYLKVTDQATNPDTVWYSETFVVHSDVSTYLKLKFQNDTNIGGLVGKVDQICYVDTILKTPTYLREDTGDKRDGLVVREKQVIMKSYATRAILAPEYIVDAFQLVPLMDSVSLTTQSGEVMTFNEIRINDPEWQSEAKGSRAKIELQFIKDVVVKKLTFRETGYTGDDAMSTIKQGVGTLSLVGDEYVLDVVFADAMPSADYTPAAYVVSTGTLTDAQLPYIPDASITATGFTVKSIVACKVRWTAIYVG